MFERFNHEARAAVVRAQDEARELGHAYLGTEHLLLGLFGLPDAIGGRILHRVGLDAHRTREAIVRRVGEGPSAGPLSQRDAEALRSLGIDVEEIRRSAEEAFGPGALERKIRRRSPPWRHSRCEDPLPMGGRMPFSPRAKKALELSLREALHLGHRYIGTEHVLLGLLREGEGLAAEILVEAGVDLRRIRRMVIDELRGPGDGSGTLVPSA